MTDTACCGDLAVLEDATALTLSMPTGVVASDADAGLASATGTSG